MVTLLVLATTAVLVVVGRTGGLRPPVHLPVIVGSGAGWSASPDAESVTFLGDSWTYGTGASDRRGYAVLTGEELGWPTTVLGIGGTGYSVPPGGDTYDRRVALAAATRPGVLVLQGSLNEQHSTPAALAVAADRTFAHVRTLADPATRILVVGASYDPGTPDATIDWVNRAVRAAAQRHGLPFVDPSRWIDPHDSSLWYDPLHPDDAGHRLMADRLAPLLLGLVRG